MTAAMKTSISLCLILPSGRVECSSAMECGLLNALFVLFCLVFVLSRVRICWSAFIPFDFSRSWLSAICFGHITSSVFMTRPVPAVHFHWPVRTGWQLGLCVDFPAARAIPA